MSKRLKLDVIRMIESEWKTRREAYWRGYDDGEEFGESSGYRSAVPVVFLSFVLGFVGGAVVI